LRNAPLPADFTAVPKNKFPIHEEKMVNKFKIKRPLHNDV
jgi:hypothetical protein